MIMIIKLLSSIVALVLCLPLFAGAAVMNIKLKDGQVIRYNVENVVEVDFIDIPEESIPDTSELTLKFEIISDSTVKVVRDHTKVDMLTVDSVNIPPKVRIDGIVYDVTGIGNCAFCDYLSLKSVTIPESVTTIEEYAFNDCYNLTEINIPQNVSDIGTGALGACSSLNPYLLVYDNGTKCYGWVGSNDSCINVVIPEGVTSIGSTAFYGCCNLTCIEIPDGVASIGEKAFYGCIYEA